MARSTKKVLVEEPQREMVVEKELVIEILKDNQKKELKENKKREPIKTLLIHPPKLERNKITSL